MVGLHGGGPVVKVPAKALDDRRFWEAMDALDQGMLAEIQARLGHRMVT